MSSAGLFMSEHPRPRSWTKLLPRRIPMPVATPDYFLQARVPNNSEHGETQRDRLFEAGSLPKFAPWRVDGGESHFRNEFQMCAPPPAAARRRSPEIGATTALRKEPLQRHWKRPVAEARHSDSHRLARHATRPALRDQARFQ